jgi:surface antigen
MSFSSARIVRAAASIAVTVVLAAGIAITAAAPASAAIGATSATLCKGYATCAAYGMTSHGYVTAGKNMYWRMYAGHNCTNYAAYMMVKAGLSNTRPWTNATGDAAGWGVGMKKKTNTTPAVGSIAWWTGGSGHVAYVEAVLSPTEIIISEDSWGGDFYWRVISKANGNWPKGFIHFKDAKATGVPAYRAKANTTTVWLDSTKQTLATTTVMNPGKTYWVEQTYLNTGTATWSGLELATQAPEDHDSKLATATWLAANRATVQQQAVVAPGQLATFAFPITIPLGLADGTAVIEKFAPVLPGTADRASWGTSTLTLTADSRSVFVTTPTPTISGTPAEEAILSAKAGTWKPSTSGAVVTYSWKRNGVTIAGATASTYALTESDVGRKITVTTTAKADRYIAASRTSVATATVTSKLPAKIGADVKLETGGELVSTNGRFSLEQRASGSLVLSDRLSGEVLWVNGAKGKAKYTVLTVKGSLASYSKEGKLVWSSKTSSKGVTQVAVTSDGKLRLRTSTLKTIWVRD